uniref:Uncharacterized protein n=1 Tax=Caenorhabditis japonica TaxID=281687 RepID=A0A8R1IXN0_CAEJA
MAIIRDRQVDMPTLAKQFMTSKSVIWASLGSSSISGRSLQLKEEWTKIPLQAMTNLIESMQRRCEAVIKAKGMATRLSRK